MDRQRTELRDGLPPLPHRIRSLPVDARGYPIPWFVADVGGVRDFRVADAEKRARAVRHRLCWICGHALSGPRQERLLHFVIGPMCAVNRVSSEPSSHLDCAEFAVRACPFMLLPRAQYREAGLPEGADMPGEALKRNSGVSAIYSCASCQPFAVSPGWLIRMSEPVDIRWYAEGRAATRPEVLGAIDSGMPHLRKLAAQDGGRAGLELDFAYQRLTLEWLPA